jgi:hypothetical protein
MAQLYAEFCESQWQTGWGKTNEMVWAAEADVALRLQYLSS